MNSSARSSDVVKALPRTVWILGAASFLTDVSSEMIYPLLPEFLAKVLGATALSLGLIEGLAESTASLFKVYAGLLTDRSGRRKPLIVSGYAISGLARPLIGLAPVWGVVLLLRFTDRVGKGLRSSPRDALISDVTAKEHLGRAFGVQRGLDHAGSVVGPLVAAALLGLAGMDLRSVFLLAAVPAALTVVLLGLGIKEPATASPPARREPLRPLRDFRGLDGGLKQTLACVLLFTLGNSTDAFLLLKLTDAGVPTAWLVALWSLQSVVKMASNAWFGRLIDKAGARPMLLGGWTLYAVLYVAFAFVDEPAPLVALFLVYGLYFGLTEPAERVLVARAAGPAQRGAAFGFFHLTVGLGALPASLLFGALWTGVSPMAAFLTGAALAAAASGLLMRTRDAGT